MSFARLALPGLLALAAAGCATEARFVTDPPGARVRAASGPACTTPCAMEVSGPVTISKEGYRTLNATARPGGSVKAKMELTAPTVGVEETALPAL